jgi:hypothetical protein
MGQLLLADSSLEPDGLDAFAEVHEKGAAFHLRRLWKFVEPVYKLNAI